MEKIALITDSTSDLTREQIEEHNIQVMPLRIIYKEKEYIDRVNISPEEVYNNLHIEVPTTSLPSMNDMELLFKRLENEGYSHAIAVTISSGLSGTYNSLKLASENHPDINSYIFDSLSLSLGAGALVIECARMIEAGMKFDEITSKLVSIRDNIKIYYVLDTLHYLIKGGRIGKVSGTIGEILNIKPIISVNNEGVYYTYDKARGRKKSILRLVEIAQETLKLHKAKIWVLHGGALEEGRKLFEEISKLKNITELNFGDISPVAGVHTGPGLLGLTMMIEPD